MHVTDEVFDQIITEAMDRLPKQLSHVKNVAIIVENQPSPEQREKLHIHDGTLLFGLYEGVPLPVRGGREPLLPDKITLFKEPIEAVCNNLDELKEHVRHTLWHELAHYYGLDHQRIHELE